MYCIQNQKSQTKVAAATFLSESNIVLINDHYSVVIFLVNVELYALLGILFLKVNNI